MLRLTDLLGGFIIPAPSKLYSLYGKYMIITHFSKPNFERQKPTLGKMVKTNSDAHFKFFAHCKKYFKLKSF